jgi:cysteinyl-tRNA synthetase
VIVSNWGYQLHDAGGLDAASLAEVTHDLMVMDFSSDGTGRHRFSADEVADIKDGPGGRSVAAAYLSIGEASEFRDHWNSAWTNTGRASGALTTEAPDWLGPTNPDWPESRKVRFWDDAWQEELFNEAGTGWLDQIVSQGFDAAYLDIVDAYYYWAVEAPNGMRQANDPARNDERDAAERMIDFIVEMSDHARQTNPDFFMILQNGAFIIDALADADPVRKAALLDVIGAIAVEDTYFTGNRDENNQLNPDDEKISVLQDDFLDNEIPVFAVDYLSNPGRVDRFHELAISDGFIPFAASDRDLDDMSPVLADNRASMRSDYLTGQAGRDIIRAKGGNDVVEGLGGNDRILGGAGQDRVLGGAGQDHLSGNRGRDSLYGGQGNDRLAGGAGFDQLTGGAGSDRFVFSTGSGRDRVMDFQNDVDSLELNEALWGGGKDAAQVLQEYGAESGRRFELDFGEGDLLVLRNITAEALMDDIIFF